MNSISYGEGKTLKIEKIDEKKMTIEYNDNNVIYNTECELEYLEELFKEGITYEEIMNHIRNERPEIEENINENEIYIIIRNGERRIRIALQNKIKRRTKEGGIAPPVIYYTRGNNIDNNSNKKDDLEKRIKDLEKEYYDKLKVVKETNDELIKKNKELKKNIDEEKKKTDEIYNIYLINKQKYEEAVKMNTKINQLKKSL